MRTNVYKKKILALLQKKHLMSIADIHNKIVDANYSTIYRNVEQLVKDTQIRKVVLGKDHVMYELCGHQHDHFLCVDCGDIEVIHVPLADALLKKYQVHDLLIKGLCKDCNQEV